MCVHVLNDSYHFQSNVWSHVSDRQVFRKYQALHYKLRLQQSCNRGEFLVQPLRCRGRICPPPLVGIGLRYMKTYGPVISAVTSLLSIRKVLLKEKHQITWILGRKDNLLFHKIMVRLQSCRSYLWCWQRTFPRSANRYLVI